MNLTDAECMRLLAIVGTFFGCGVLIGMSIGTPRWMRKLAVNE